MTRYTHTMCMAFGADGEPDRVEVDATFDYLVTGSAVSDIRVLKIDGRDVNVADADLHDLIHDDLESGRFDDLLISITGTGGLEPCPFCGSDVRIRKGVNGYGLCQTEGCHANRAQIVSLDDPKQVAAWNRRAAPAPSSLAGGDRKQFLCDVLCGVALDGNEPIGETADRILAALSPEAPAEKFTISRAEYEALKAGYPGDPSLLHEAPAEGAGEAMTEREVRQWIDACNHEPARQVLRDYLDLRARSSAPEAREEALGNLLAVIHGDGGHRALEVGTKQAALEAEKIVAGLLAAPSADKLRTAVEALEPFANLGVSSGPDDEPCHYAYRITRGAIRNARQAIAVLKAEGAK